MITRQLPRLARAAPVLRSSRSPTQRPKAPALFRTYASKPPNPTSQFYKTFTRPIAKVLLVAVLTYQVLYWGWVRLETDEVKAETESEIAKLEAKLNEYKDSKMGEKKNAGAKS